MLFVRRINCAAESKRLRIIRTAGLVAMPLRFDLLQIKTGLAFNISTSQNVSSALVTLNDCFLCYFQGLFACECHEQSDDQHSLPVSMCIRLRRQFPQR